MGLFQYSTETQLVIKGPLSPNPSVKSDIFQAFPLPWAPSVVALGLNKPGTVRPFRTGHGTKICRFFKWGIPKSPWVSIFYKYLICIYIYNGLKCSNLDDLEAPPFWGNSKISARNLWLIIAWKLWKTRRIYDWFSYGSEESLQTKNENGWSWVNHNGYFWLVGVSM